MLDYYAHYPETPASQALKALIAELAQPANLALPTDQGIYARPLDERILRATPQDCVAAGFRFSDRHAPNPICGSRHGDDFWLRMDFSPHYTHQALSYERSDDAVFNSYGTPTLWLDGQPIAVPRDDEGGSLIDSGGGRWADDRFFAVRLGGLHDHPLIRYGIATHHLGRPCGLLIFDVERHTRQIVLPADDQYWDVPILARRGDRLVIYANGDDHDANRVGWTSEPLD